MFEFITRWLNKLELKPVPFKLLNKVAEPYYLNSQKLSFPKRDGYNLNPELLPELSKKDQVILEQRLTWILNDVYNLIFEGEIPESIKDYTVCVRRSLLCYAEIRKHGLPARLITCFIKVPSLGGIYDVRPHMVAECNGWILDAAFGYEGAAKANRMYMANWTSISGYELTEPWHRIAPDKRLIS